jgi:hypothetical protein
VLDFLSAEVNETSAPSSRACVTLSNTSPLTVATSDWAWQKKAPCQDARSVKKMMIAGLTVWLSVG